MLLLFLVFTVIIFYLVLCKWWATRTAVVSISSTQADVIFVRDLRRKMYDCIAAAVCVSMLRMGVAIRLHPRLLDEQKVVNKYVAEPIRPNSYELQMHFGHLVVVVFVLNSGQINKNLNMLFGREMHAMVVNAIDWKNLSSTMTSSNNLLFIRRFCCSGCPGESHCLLSLLVSTIFSHLSGGEREMSRTTTESEQKVTVWLIFFAVFSYLFLELRSCVFFCQARWLVYLSVKVWKKTYIAATALLLWIRDKVRLGYWGRN